MRKIRKRRNRRISRNRRRIRKRRISRNRRRIRKRRTDLGKNIFCELCNFGNMDMAGKNA